MPSIPELPYAARVVLRALFYAGLITLLVIFLPSGDHTFIYQEF